MYDQDHWYVPDELLVTLKTFMCSPGRYAMKPIVQFDERLHIRVALGRMKKCLLLCYIWEFVLYLRVCVTFESLCQIWDLVLYLSFVLYLRFWQRSSCLGREDRPSPSMQRTINVIKSLFENFGTSLVLAHQRSNKVITEALALLASESSPQTLTFSEKSLVWVSVENNMKSCLSKRELSRGNCWPVWREVLVDTVRFWQTLTFSWD